MLPYIESHIDTSEVYRVVQDELGVGTYGSVFGQEDHPDRVVKIYEKGSELLPSSLREISSLVMLSRYEHIPTIHNVYIDDTRHRISLDRYDGSLEHIFEQKIFREITVKRLLYQMLTTMIVLNNHNITHRDFKPGNILYKMQNGNYQFVLCDFGLARFANSKCIDGQLSGNIQTMWYRAPETLNGKGKYNLEKIDVWSLGVICYEMLEGKPCVPGNNEATQALLIKKQFGSITGRQLKTSGVSKELEKLLQQMTILDDKKRPTARALLKNEYFADCIGIKDILKISNSKKVYYDLANTFDLKQLDQQQRIRTLIIDQIDEFFNSSEIFSNQETEFTALVFLDKILSAGVETDMLERDFIVSIVIACLALAAKIHEHHLITCEILCQYFDRDDLYQDVIDLERQIVKLFNFMLFVPSAYTLMRFKLKESPSELMIRELLISIKNLSWHKKFM